MKLKKFDPYIMKFFRCPIDREHRLVRLNSGFKCNICKRVFISKYSNGVEIPDFLIKKDNWIQGYRGLSSKLISVFQKKTRIKQYSRSDKWVLDIGCGDNARGNINVDCYIPTSIPSNFLLANAEYLPFKNKCVDTVTCYYIIEHLINPSSFIMTNCSISTRKVRILTDNSEWIGDIFFRIIGSGRIFHDEHTYKWSKEYISNLIRRLGINKVRVLALNLSSTPLVKFISIFGKIPRIGIFFYRDIMVEIFV